MTRQERVRRENPHSNDWQNDQSIQRAPDQDYAASVERENAERTAEAHDNFERSQERDKIFIGKRVASQRKGNIQDYCCLVAWNGYECSCE